MAISKMQAEAAIKALVACKAAKMFDKTLDGEAFLEEDRA